MARERRSQYEAATDPAEKARLRQEWQELKDYTKMIDNGEASNGVTGYSSGEGQADVLGIEESVKSHKADGQNSELVMKSHAEARANEFFAKYAKEIVTKAAATKEQQSPQEQQPLSRDELKDKLLKEEFNKVYDDPDELLHEVGGARASFFSDRLQKMRDRNSAEPTEANQKALQTIEGEMKGFTRLLEFANQWQDQKLSGQTNKNFAEYMTDRNEAADAEVVRSIEEGGGKVGKLAPERAQYVDGVKAAYEAGWSQMNYSLRGRIARRVVPIVRSRLNVTR
jgi:hypothetical protein